jgi:hypothetical protein
MKEKERDEKSQQMAAPGTPARSGTNFFFFVTRKDAK